MSGVSSKLKVSGAKPAKPAPRPSAPGKRCPNCGEELVRPDPGGGGYYPGWDSWEDAPHENPFDCIRFLRKEIDRTKDDVKDVQRDVENAGRDRPLC